MAIPRFTAQVGQIQVPSMKDYQRDENESISRSLADFGSAVLKSTVKMAVAMEKERGKNVDALEEERLLAVKNNKPQAYIDDITNRLNKAKEGYWWSF